MNGKARLVCVTTNRVTPWKKNLFLNSASTILARLCSGDIRYRLAMMYIEFANVASPGDTVVAPTYSVDSDRGYYDSLLSDPTNDYLRVPIFAFGVTVSSEQEAVFPGGNVLTMTAKTAGLVGVHGKPFSADYNSTVIGGAVVATPEPDNADADVLFNRWYNDESAQLLKPSNGQLSVEWQVDFAGLE